MATQLKRANAIANLEFMAAVQIPALVSLQYALPHATYRVPLLKDNGTLDPTAIAGNSDFPGPRCDTTLDKTEHYRFVYLTKENLESLNHISVSSYNVCMVPEWKQFLNKADTSRAVHESFLKVVFAVHDARRGQDAFENEMTLDTQQFKMCVWSDGEAKYVDAVPDFARVRVIAQNQGIATQANPGGAAVDPGNTVTDYGKAALNTVQLGVIIAVEIMTAGSLVGILGFRSRAWDKISSQIESYFSATDYVVLCDYFITILFVKKGVRQYEHYIERGIDGRMLMLYALEQATTAFDRRHPLPLDPGSRDAMRAAIRLTQSAGHRKHREYISKHIGLSSDASLSGTRLASQRDARDATDPVSPWRYLAEGAVLSISPFIPGPLRGPTSKGMSLAMSQAKASVNKVQLQAEPTNGAATPHDKSGVEVTSGSKTNHDNAFKSGGEVGPSEFLENDTDDKSAITSTLPSASDDSVTFTPSSPTEASVSDQKHNLTRTPELSNLPITTNFATLRPSPPYDNPPKAISETLPSSKLDDGQSYRTFPKGLVEALSYRQVEVVVKLLKSSKETRVYKCQLAPIPDSCLIEQTPFILKFFKKDDRLQREKEVYQILQAEQGDLIPFYYGHFRTAGTDCLALEYLEGTPLRDWARQSLQNYDAINGFFRSWSYRFLTLLQYRLSHRDLYLRNVMMVNKRPVLYDFESTGIVVWPERDTTTLCKCLFEEIEIPSSKASLIQALYTICDCLTAQAEQVLYDAVPA